MISESKRHNPLFRKVADLHNMGMIPFVHNTHLE